MNLTPDGRMIWWAMEIAGPTPRKKRKAKKRKPRPLATLVDVRRKYR